MQHSLYYTDWCSVCITAAVKVDSNSDLVMIFILRASHLAVNVECELLAMWTKFLQWLYWNKPPSQSELHPPQMLSYCLSDLTPSDGCVSFPSTVWLHPLFKSATPHPKGGELGPVSPAPAHPLKVVEVLLEVGVEGLRDQGLCQCERVHKVCPACSPASWLTTMWSVQSTWISMM